MFERSACSLHRLSTDAETVAILKVEGPSFVASLSICIYIIYYVCYITYTHSYTCIYKYTASGRRTYSGTVRKEEKNGERETRLTQGGFWLIGQTYKFVATYPWIT